MPTKKRRVGFIPRSDVLALINQLSNDSNLSYSKIINILVEEALFKRGLFHKASSQESDIAIEKYFVNKEPEEKIENVNREFENNFKNKLQNDKSLHFKDVREETFDEEIYAKFLIFLKFQERMKKRNSNN